MANSTKCLTSGAIFHTHIKEDGIVTKITLPFNLDIDKGEAEIIETLIHNSLETILRPYFLDKPNVSSSISDSFKVKIKEILSKNESLSMDNKGDRDKLFEEIVSRLSTTEWWEQKS